MKQSAGPFMDYSRTFPQKPSRDIFVSARKLSKLFKPECSETLKVRSLPSTEPLIHDKFIIKKVNSLVTLIATRCKYVRSASKLDIKPTCVHNEIFRSAKSAAPKNQQKATSADRDVPHAVDM
ncbi:hypothetical protein HPB51_001383 [Rhipicephalus microplus]|uniref:Uncharacterized protein n=1 Tax=Rhipicephalus microplus TaxID=6941 RepID=A0A9J6EE23_RHIMP|nr:hypothetical protein HPB51_001383 [Rhipicephalus microplus]